MGMIEWVVPHGTFPNEKYDCSCQMHSSEYTGMYIVVYSSPKAHVMICTTQGGAAICEQRLTLQIKKQVV